MRFRRKVHNCIELFVAQQLLDERRIADVAVYEAKFRASSGRFQIRHIAGVGQGIQHHNPLPGMLSQPVMYKVRSDESGAAGDEELRHALYSKSCVPRSLSGEYREPAAS